MATAGSDKLARRSGERRPPVKAPVDVGAALRRAREAIGVTVAEVRDRTGVSWQHLEALETMQLGRLPDQRSVVTAARRYAEVVGLDASEICGTALRAWQDEHWSPPRPPAAAVGQAPGGVTPPHGTGRWRRRNGAAGPPRPAGPPAGPPAPEATTAPTGTAASAGTGPHPTQSGPGAGEPVTQVFTPRAPEEPPHLRAFTRTAEVPSLARPGGGATPGALPGTASAPITPRVRAGVPPSPLWLRLSVALVAALLVLGVAGLVVYHVQPAWLASLHLTHRQTASSGGGQTGSAPSSGTGTHHLVDQVQTGTASATATVHARNYQVVITAQQPCWVQATDPSSGSSVFSGLLAGGTTKTLDPVAGRLSVQFGASRVTAQVQVSGKALPGWSFSPTNAPFTLDFTSA